VCISEGVLEWSVVFFCLGGGGGGVGVLNLELYIVYV